MRSIQECESGLGAVLGIYAAQSQVLARMDPKILEIVRQSLGKGPEDVIQQHVPVLENIFAELIQHNSAEAVRVACNTFSSHCAVFQTMALKAIGAMSCDAARKALKRHAAWWSWTSPDEKTLARALLLSGKWGQP